MRTSQAEFPVIGADVRLAGVLTSNAIFQAISSDQPTMAVSEAIVTGIPTVILGAPLETALGALFTTGAPVVAVTEPRGVMLGYITHENTGKWMVTQVEINR